MKLIEISTIPKTIEENTLAYCIWLCEYTPNLNDCRIFFLWSNYSLFDIIPKLVRKNWFIRFPRQTMFTKRTNFWLSNIFQLQILGIIQQTKSNSSLTSMNKSKTHKICPCTRFAAHTSQRVFKPKIPNLSMVPK